MIVSMALFVYLHCLEGELLSNILNLRTKACNDKNALTIWLCFLPLY